MIGAPSRSSAPKAVGSSASIHSGERLRLSRAKHRSLAGHARIAKRIASLIPGYAYGVERKRRLLALERGRVPDLRMSADQRRLDLMLPWFAGAEFTAADVQMSFPLEAAAARGGSIEAFPKIKAFLARIHARPAYRQALERGGPYDLMS